MAEKQQHSQRRTTTYSKKLSSIELTNGATLLWWWSPNLPAKMWTTRNRVSQARMLAQKISHNYKIVVACKWCNCSVTVVPLSVLFYFLGEGDRILLLHWLIDWIRMQFQTTMPACYIPLPKKIWTDCKLPSESRRF